MKNFTDYIKSINEGTNLSENESEVEAEPALAGCQNRQKCRRISTPGVRYVLLSAQIDSMCM